MMRIARYIAPAGILALILLLAASAYSGDLTGQERDKILKDARYLIKRGNRLAAIQVVEGLYRADPLDDMVVRAFSGMLIEAGQYEKAERVLKDYISRRPDDMRALAELASLRFRLEDPDGARELIGRIVSRAPRELWPYQLGLDAMIDNDMKPEILAFIGEARVALGDSTLFAVDAARVHESQGTYSKATHEYLLASLHERMSDETCAGYIMRMARLDDARPEVISALERAVAIEIFGGVVGRAIWEVHLLDGACGQALEELQELAAGDGNRAEMLVDFGRRAAEEGCFAECRKAYQLAIACVPEPSRVPSYLLKQAECELASGLTEDALATYDEVASRYKASKWASYAMLARARVYKDVGRLAEATAEADRIISSERDADVRLETVLFKGDLLLLSGNLEEAFATYDLVSTDWPGEYAQEAFFNLGEISFYEAEFDDALSYYNVTLREYPDGTRANDAIERLLVIKSSGGDGSYSPGLGEFARASFNRRRGLTEEAMEGFRKSADARGDLATHSLKQISEIHVETGSFEEAVKTYRLLGETLDVYLSPSALEAIGDVYMGLGRIDDAVGAYENVILKYPASVSAGEARRKMESVRRVPNGS